MPRIIGFSTYTENFQGCDFTDEEWAFVNAVVAYQKRWNRRYPSWREVFHILKSLGYRKIEPPVTVGGPPPPPAAIQPTKIAPVEPTPSAPTTEPDPPGGTDDRKRGRRRPLHRTE